MRDTQERTQKSESAITNTNDSLYQRLSSDGLSGDFRSSARSASASATESLVSAGTLPNLSLDNGSGSDIILASGPRPLTGYPVLKPRPDDQHPTGDS